MSARTTQASSALLSTAQQVGGSLGTALLSTVYTSAVTAYLTGHLRTAADPQRLHLDAALHGYRVAFFWAAVLLLTAMAAAVALITARRNDVPAEPAAVAA